MQGFSHAERIGGRIDLLKPERLQEMICKGTDPFGMLPEAYTVCWIYCVFIFLVF
jgi:beta-1,4-mannosyl-glycoprotein beta-1,4-N-acetylglucosaminyltransferase